MPDCDGCCCLLSELIGKPAHWLFLYAGALEFAPDRGCRAFSVRKRDARNGRNPRTGQKVDVAEKFVPFFKTGKELRDRLNHKGKTPH